MEEGSRSFVICSVMLAVIACLGALSLLARADRVHFTRSPQFTAGCGNWQQKYVKLHRQITTGRQAKRFCVATTRSEKGLYDRLTGDHWHRPRRLPNPAWIPRTSQHATMYRFLITDRDACSFAARFHLGIWQYASPSCLPSVPPMR